MARTSRALRASIALNALLVTALTLVAALRASSTSPSSRATSSAMSVWRAERLTVLAALPARAGGVVVLGDSLVERGEWSELLGVAHAKNRGVAGDTTADVLARVVSALQPGADAVVLLAGTNDVERGAAVEDVAATYERILERVADGVSPSGIVVVSAPPVRDGLADRALSNDALAKLSRRLSELARVRGCRFVDSAAVLADASGQLDARFTLDGVHLTGPGYEALAAAIRRELAAR